MLTESHQALEQGDPEAAIPLLLEAVQAQPDRAEAHYLLAVAYRRSGDLDHFRARLDHASALGWATGDIERQRWLANAQLGDVESVQGRLFETIESGAPDDVAEEVYEAIAQGHVAANRFHDAGLCLDMWLQWRPNAPQARLLRGALYEMMAELPLAVEDYRAVVERLPGSRVARVRLGRLLLGQGKNEEAEAQFRACLDPHPEDPDALLGAARCAHARGADEEAHRLLDTALARELPIARRGDVLGELGRLLLDEGRITEAVDTLTRAAACGPAEGPVHYQLALALTRAGQPEKAQEHARKAEESRIQQGRLIEIRRLLTKADNPDLRYEAGMILVNQGFEADGIGWLQGVLRSDPFHHKTHEFLAVYYTKAGGKEKAAHHRKMRLVPVLAALDAKRTADVERDLAALEKLPGFEPHRHFLRGALFLQQGKFYPALDEFGHSFNEPELRVRTLTLSGEALYRLKKFRDAAGLLEQAVAAEPKAADGHRWLASAYYDLGLRNEAMTHLQRIVELDPKDPRPHRLMGLIQKDSQIYGKAEESYRESLRRDADQPDRDNIHLELARCQIKLLKDREALETLAPTRPSPDRWVLEAECYDRAGRKDEALRLIGEALKQAPRHVQGMTLKGAILLEQGNSQAAADVLSRAVAIAPNDYALRSKLLQAYRRLGDTERIKEHAKAAEELKQLWEDFSKLHDQAAAEPDNAEVRCRLGIMARRLDRDDLAEVWFQAALAIDPRHAETLRQVAARPASEGKADKPIPALPR